MGILADSGGGQGIDDRRRSVRVGLQLRLALVYHQRDEGCERPIYHGITQDISMSGLSIVLERNIFHEGEITVLLALPPERRGEIEKIISVTGYMTYAIHSSKLDAFKIGIAFREFKGEGRDLLQAALLRELNRGGDGVSMDAGPRVIADRPDNGRLLPG
jgi:hypothetical protein